jgi:hypothetical protein
VVEGILAKPTSGGGKVKEGRGKVLREESIEGKSVGLNGAAGAAGGSDVDVDGDEERGGRKRECSWGYWIPFWEVEFRVSSISLKENDEIFSLL